MKFNLKSLSLMSIVLMGASAVTAAIIPNKSTNFQAKDGSISQLGTDAGVLTCTPTDAAQNTACNASTTEGSLTTAPAGLDSAISGGEAQTEGNTTTK